jgi:hypothetical protein
MGLNLIEVLGITLDIYSKTFHRSILLSYVVRKTVFEARSGCMGDAVLFYVLHWSHNPLC